MQILAAWVPAGYRLGVILHWRAACASRVGAGGRPELHEAAYAPLLFIF